MDLNQQIELAKEQQRQMEEALRQQASANRRCEVRMKRNIDQLKALLLQEKERLKQIMAELEHEQPRQQ